MNTVFAKYTRYILLPLLASCATVQHVPTGGATCVEGWYSKAGAFYTAHHAGEWYMLVQPHEKDSAIACLMSIKHPSEMDVKQEVTIGKLRPVGFAVNERGEFITSQGGKIHVYGRNGEPLVAFNATVQDSRLNSPIATDAQDRIYVATTNGVEIFTRDGNRVNSLALEGIPLSVAVAPDQTVWCVSDAQMTSHLTHFAAYPQYTLRTDYSRQSRPITGLAAANGNNYSNWRELAVTDNRVMVTHGTGTDADQCIFVLSADGGTLLNRISTVASQPGAKMVNAHGLAASRDTLLYFDYDASMAKWLNRVTPLDTLGAKSGM